MRQLICDPRAETLGIHFLAFSKNLQEQQARPLMQKHGVKGVAGDSWIPTQLMLDALREMSRISGSTDRLLATGIEIGQAISFGPEVDTLGAALAAWDASYHAVHRGADVGSKRVEEVDDRHYRIILTDLYPDDFNYGILYGFALRFLPPGVDFAIYYDPAINPRDRGGDHGCTVIHIRWT